ncbi:MAG: lycopene cyclase domain-containing protein [Candidatus Promineifilaceae bacterium]
MTYFSFLVYFLVIPIILLGIVAIVDRRRGTSLPVTLRAWPPWAAILLHVFVALLYTTLWDNYLVATRVWWYDPELVTGITLGWVPIEEYTFFILQPILAGLWLLFLARRLTRVALPGGLVSWLRVAGTALLGLFWLSSAIILAAGWQPGNYLALELVWALPPIGLQLAFGADILWRFRRLVFLVIGSLTFYLSATDAIAITLGTWTINSEKSLDLLIAGLLPIEELLFFLLTTTLITFGIVLVMAQESHNRLGDIRRHLSKAEAGSPNG